MSDKIAITYTTSDNRIISLSESNLPLTSRELSPLERTKLVIEIITLLALIATFGCYVVLTFLQSSANDANARAFKYARLPWISLTDPGASFDGTKIRAGVTLDNHTDSPALDITERWDVEGLEQIPIDRQVETEHLALMPHDEIRRIADFGGPLVQSLYADMADGKRGLICHLTFTDVGRDKLSMTFKIKYSNAAKVFLITDVEPTGDYTKL